MNPKNEKEKIKKEKKHEKEVLNKMERENSSLGSFMLETLLNIIVILVVVGLVRWFVVTPFVVEGESMEIAFSNGEYILVDKLTYQFEDPKRGDVIIFNPPVRQSTDYYIKRIIGLPGETVELRDGYVYICNEDYPDCFLLEEGGYLSEESMGQACVNKTTCPDVSYEIPENAYFVLGDNRARSHDSRLFENSGGTFYVPKANIEGKSWLGAWPQEEFGFTPAIDYFYPEKSITVMTDENEEEVGTVEETVSTKMSEELTE